MSEQADNPGGAQGGAGVAASAVTSGRWHKIKELFGAALELDAAGRKAMLDQACEGDPSLRREVETLLAASTSATGRVRPTPEPDRMIGRRLGAYEVLKLAGAGGMAAVYLATRADDQYRKRVAIKIVYPGLEKEAVCRRFRNERQTLAALDHPNIVKLLDGGATSEGLPYLVMDYVEGLPIDDYCDGHKLSIEGRLRLFLTVCGAVEYAHQQLIIHRDLKPGNILVTAEGVPKLLDFGIAKLLNPEFWAQDMFLTQTGMGHMTPAYASPEQVRGQPVTCASDIYSLGVVLYELLTGHRPYRFKSYTPAELERVICETEVERPSTVVTRVEMEQGGEGSSAHLITPESVSRTRESQPEKLSRRLKGDLDNIVLKTLHKEPQRRYASTAEFSQDIQRHLDQLPVKARRATFAYRTSKFIRRMQRALTGSAIPLPPRLETLPRRGYRFTGSINRVAAHPPGAIRSVAVLPLENLSGDTAQEYFADGLTEALITYLAKIRELRVISRTTAMQYKKPNRSLPEIARELHVDSIVEGTVLRSGDRVRISAQLVDARTDSHIWAESYERNLRDILSLHSELARSIAGQIQVTLTPGEQRQLGPGFPVHPEAYEAYLKGRHHWNRRSADDLNKAMGYFQRAIEKEPDYAPAHTGLADCAGIAGFWSFASPTEGCGKAKAAALNSLKIEETAEARASLGWAILHYDWDFPAAQSEFQRAIQLNPRYATAHQWYGHCLGGMGRFDEAYEVLRHGIQLEPLELIIGTSYAGISWLGQQWDQAIEQTKKTLDLDANFAAGLWARARSYDGKGMRNEAIAYAQEAVNISGGTQLFFLADLGHAHAAAGNQRQAIEVLQKLQGIQEHRYVDPCLMAHIHVALGQADEAFKCLEQASQVRAAWFTYLPTDPWFDPLRRDPRFYDLLQRAGLSSRLGRSKREESAGGPVK